MKSEDLVKSLRNVGLASGKILDRSTLEDARQFLVDQYFSRGRYGVVVDPKVEEPELAGATFPSSTGER